MSRIHIEVLTPGNGKTYEFKLDDGIATAEIIVQLCAQIEEFEASNISFDKGRPLLCVAKAGGSLNPEHTLREAGVKSGNRLFLL